MIITLLTGSDGDSAADVAGRAVTAADLIAQLQQLAAAYGPDTPVVVRGYTDAYEPVYGAEEED